MAARSGLALALFVVCLPHVASSTTPTNCGVGKMLFDLAWRADIPVGFEALSGCIPTPRERPQPSAATVPAQPPDQILRALLAGAPEFSFRHVNGVYVVRPQAAWNDPTDPLNFETAAFDTRAADLDSALRVLIQHVFPAVYKPYTVHQSPIGSISATFTGGSMMDALNALISKGQFNEWEVAYTGTVMVTVGSHDLRAGAAIAPLNIAAPKP